MEISPLHRISSTLLARNPYWEYWLDTYSLHDGREQPYYYVHTHGSVMIIPITEDGRLVMIRQFRYLWQKESIEFPGGGIPDGATPEQQAHRELQEEAGYAAGTLAYLGTYNPMNGVTDERCHVFVAHQLQAAAKADDPVEETAPLLVTAEELTACIANGTIWDGMTLAAWALFNARQQP